MDRDRGKSEMVLRNSGWVCYSGVLAKRKVKILLVVLLPIMVSGCARIAGAAAAHGGYEHGGRVIALIAQDIGHANTANIVKEGCSRLETVGD